jgi:hypothetical protein
MMRRHGITAHVAAGSTVLAARMIAAQPVSARPLLDELEQLIDRAWADHAAAQRYAAAAQVTRSAVASDVSHPSARSMAVANDDRVRQQPALTSSPARPTPTVAPRIVRDPAAQVMLRRVEALLGSFNVADPTPLSEPEHHRELTPIPIPTRTPTR